MLKIISILGLISLFRFPVLAQVATDNHDVGFGIPAIALVDIEPNVTPFTLSFSAPTEAGSPVTAGSGATNSTKWLNYTSGFSPSAANRTITAQITGGTLPAGVQLRLQAAAYSGTGGGGTFGTSAGQKTLSGTAQIIISGIGRSYTGSGNGKGHLLTYTLALSNYALLKYSQSGTLEVTFTITD